MSILQNILAKAVAEGASDVHLKSGESPFFRVRGDLVKSEFPAMSVDELKHAVSEIIPKHLREKSATESEMDFSHYEEGVGRFRVNVFLGGNRPNLAFRHVKTKIPSRSLICRHAGKTRIATAVSSWSVAPPVPVNPLRWLL